MTRACLTAALAAALLLPAASPARSGDAPPLCTSGAFIVEGEALLARPGFEGADRIDLADGELWFASGCGRRHASLRPGAEGTRVRARFFQRPGVAAGPFGSASFQGTVAAWSWNVLNGLAGTSATGGAAAARCGPAKFVRLRATIDADCQTMTGVVRARSPRLRREFVARAAPIPVCDVTHPCAGGDFCELPGGFCGTGLDAGACVDVPDACPDVYDPVCGCDGVTYGNDCDRRAARVQKSADGACGVCGTMAGIPCANGRFCEFPADQCQGADLAGACVDVAEVCTLDWNPVCGCDGRTYGNECERRAAAVSKHHDGECENAAGAMTVGGP